MKRYYLFLMWFVFTKLLLCQSQTYFNNDTLDQVIHYGIINDDYCYFLTNSGEYIDPGHALLIETLGYKSSLLKLNKDLVLIDSITIDSLDGYLFNARKIQFFNDTIYIVGRAIKPDVSDEQIFISCYNLELELIRTSLIGEPNRLEIMSDFLINHHGKLIIPAKVYNPNWEESYFIFMSVIDKVMC